MTYALRVGASALGLALISIPFISVAAEFRAEEQPSLAASETVADDLYMAGGNVTSAGLVRGDLIGAGGNVLISGVTTGDLIAAGGSVTVLGNVGDDLRVAGGNIVIQGQVTDDLIVGGGQVTVGGAGIGGDVLMGVGTLRLEAPVQGSVRIGGGEIYLNSPIGGDVYIDAEKVTLGPRANIAGTLEYTAKEAATLEEGAVVQGETTFTERKTMGGGAGIAAILSLWFLGKILITLVGALALAFLLRRFTRTTLETAMQKPLLEIGRGLVFLIVTPIASIIFLVTVIGVPFGLLGLIALAGALIIVSMLAPIVLGSMVHSWFFKPLEYQITWKTILLGVILYTLLTLIPFVGWILKFILVLLTLGALVKVKWNAVKEWR